MGFSDFVVLYRTNVQSLPIQLEFILNDIASYVGEEDNVWEYTCVNWIRTSPYVKAWNRDYRKLGHRIR